MKKICLQSHIVYGPIASRRLGTSLGINLLPTQFKLCSLDCTYCQYGITNMKIGHIAAPESVPPVALIEKEFKSACEYYAQQKKEINFITLAGNGEPTLHPELDKIVSMISALRDQYLPDAKTAVLSNSTTVGNPKIHDILMQIDVRMMKLDAGTEADFVTINHPHKSLSYKTIVEKLCELRPLTIQTLFVDGHISNCSQSSVDALIAQYKKIQPELIHIYSLDREPSDKSLIQVDSEQLHKIKEKVELQTGIPVDVF